MITTTPLKPLHLWSRNLVGSDAGPDIAGSHFALVQFGTQSYIWQLKKWPFPAYILIYRKFTPPLIPLLQIYFSSSFLLIAKIDANFFSTQMSVTQFLPKKDQHLFLQSHSPRPLSRNQLVRALRDAAETGVPECFETISIRKQREGNINCSIWSEAKLNW